MEHLQYWEHSILEWPYQTLSTQVKAGLWWSFEKMFHFEANGPNCSVFDDKCPRLYLIFFYLQVIGTFKDIGPLAALASPIQITLGILGGGNYSPHVVCLWYLYLFCVLFVYISGNGILGAGVRKTWDVWENGYQLIIIWEPEGQFEDKAGCKYVQDATEALFI